MVSSFNSIYPLVSDSRTLYLPNIRVLVLFLRSFLPANISISPKEVCYFVFFPFSFNCVQKDFNPVQTTVQSSGNKASNRIRARSRMFFHPFQQKKPMPLQLFLIFGLNSQVTHLSTIAIHIIKNLKIYQ